MLGLCRRYHKVREGVVPSSTWKKDAILQWLVASKVKHDPKALRIELLDVARKHGHANAELKVVNIAKKYGHDVIFTPPYVRPLQSMPQALFVRGASCPFVSNWAVTNKSQCATMIPLHCWCLYCSIVSCRR